MNSREEPIISSLMCVRCAGDVVRRPAEKYSGYDGVETELACSKCDSVYPEAHGVPVIFKDEKRILSQIDPEAYKSSNQQVSEKMKIASGLAGEQLNDLREDDHDALSWEIHFWEIWKNEDDKGFLTFDPEKVDQFLAQDIEGGGRLRFLEMVLRFSDTSRQTTLLNIGAGRDFLLEKCIAKNFLVIEQDIVLEPLVLLLKRGAHFCICCDAREIPFKNDFVDVTTSFQVLHHIWPIEETIAELLRVTKGNVFFNEPNHYAFTRMGHMLPGFLKKIAKRAYASGFSRSPYELPINPVTMKRIVADNKARIVFFNYMKDSWITSNASMSMKVFRAVNLAVLKITPLVSAHFEAVISK